VALSAVIAPRERALGSGAGRVARARRPISQFARTRCKTRRTKCPRRARRAWAQGRWSGDSVRLSDSTSPLRSARPEARVLEAAERGLPFVPPNARSA